jgi:acyl-CoA synthetase (AMP-forming)/AMP-acid ligase II
MSIPREVEEFLYKHPKVAEVQVVGIPDERLGGGRSGMDPVEGRGKCDDGGGDTKVL